PSSSRTSRRAAADRAAGAGPCAPPRRTWAPPRDLWAGWSTRGRTLRPGGQSRNLPHPTLPRTALHLHPLRRRPIRRRRGSRSSGLRRRRWPPATTRRPGTSSPRLMTPAGSRQTEGIAGGPHRSLPASPRTLQRLTPLASAGRSGATWFQWLRVSVPGARKRIVPLIHLDRRPAPAAGSHSPHLHPGLQVAEITDVERAAWDPQTEQTAQTDLAGERSRLNKVSVSTLCTSKAEFVTKFGPFLDETTIFFASRLPLVIGQAVAFAICLRDRQPMLEGDGKIVEVQPLTGQSGRCGLRIQVRALTS